MILQNGIRLIVQTERTSPTVTVARLDQDAQTQLQTPPGKDGVAGCPRWFVFLWHEDARSLAFQKALDDIGASESAGASFSLKVLRQDFARGVQLLADNELHPALPADAFKIVQQQTARAECR